MLILQKTNHCNNRTSQRAIDDKKISIIVTHGKSVYHKEYLLYYLLTNHPCPLGTTTNENGQGVA
ncbi:MAG: hypothetical protein KO464_05515 [Candidatus Methanofastidiosum sp.]|nr:hypothetical protein [Methanofastidiosum sp.]